MKQDFNCRHKIAVQTTLRTKDFRRAKNKISLQGENQCLAPIQVLVHEYNKRDSFFL